MVEAGGEIIWLTQKMVQTLHSEKTSDSKCLTNLRIPCGSGVKAAAVHCTTPGPSPGLYFARHRIWGEGSDIQMRPGNVGGDRFGDPLRYLTSTSTLTSF